MTECNLMLFFSFLSLKGITPPEVSHGIDYTSLVRTSVLVVYSIDVSLRYLVLITPSTGNS